MMLNHNIIMEPAIDTTECLLYQPNPNKAILLYDMATSSSVLTFLKMNNIQTEIKNLTNTEFMSKNGRMPVVFEKNSDHPMCGFIDVFWYVNRKLNRSPTIEELAYIDWVETNFLEAEMYLCWCYEPIVNDYTRNRYTYDLPWPVSTILFNRKREQMRKNVGNKFKDFDQSLSKFESFLTKLNFKINRPAGSEDQIPSCVNALVYAHTKAITNTKLHPRFTNALTNKRRIIHLTEDVERQFPS